ncbi:MAG TPA: hypothetical protein VKU85_12700 [bacterium]|nr:hypothetical protein [bacterium]
MKVALILIAWVLVAAVPASAQTRLSLVGGGLVPFGDLDEGAEPSAAFGLRAEYQPVNALGQPRLLSIHLSTIYSELDRDGGELPAELADSDPFLLEFTGGVRAYSSVAPFFVTGTAGFAKADLGLGGESVSGFTAGAGLGFVAPVMASLVEVEGVIHQVLAEDDVNFQYLTVMLGLGLPF